MKHFPRLYPAFGIIHILKVLTNFILKMNDCVLNYFPALFKVMVIV